MYDNLFQKLFAMATFTVAIGFLFSLKTLIAVGYLMAMVAVTVFLKNLVLAIRSDQKKDKT